MSRRAFSKTPKRYFASFILPLLIHDFTRVLGPPRYHHRTLIGGLGLQTLSVSKYDRNVYRTKFAAA
jgi:hypothetical protein